MVVCGSYMFEFSVSRDKERKNDNGRRRIPAYLIAYLLTLVVKGLRINVEQGRVVTILHVIKHQILYLV